MVGRLLGRVVVACAVVVVAPIEPSHATAPQASDERGEGGGDHALAEGGDAAAARQHEGGVHAHRLGAAAEIALGGP